jgi:hypothetical protein
VINRIFGLFVKHLDPFLITVVAVLLSIGMVVLYSASGQNFCACSGSFSFGGLGSLPRIAKSKTARAIGAAAEPPWPPFSTRIASATLGFSAGAYAM